MNETQKRSILQMARGAVTGNVPRETVNGRLPRGYRVLSHDESMEIEFRHLREMAERYGALIERDRRERDVPV